MISAIGQCAGGLLVLILGAEFLTRGGTMLARQFGIPPIIIGLTVVALGTSTPELAVGIDAALTGNGALAVGNIAGTNTVNVLLILGLSAMIRPLALHVQTIRMDLPVMIVAAVLMLLMTLDGTLSRLDGAILVLAGIVYTVMVVWTAQHESRAVRVEFAKEYRGPKRTERKRRETVSSATLLAAGIVIVVVAADWFVDGAVSLARIWGVSDAFIGLTIVAIGTSAPELVTTVLSTLKNSRDIAIGNLLGSSVYNIFIILGVTCLVPSGGLPVTPYLVRVDIPVMAVVAVVCVPVFVSGREVSRLEGACFVGAYVAYLFYLVMART
ncbi:calcium/sodium antiporter [Neoroseomonas soli]|uniref:Calcium/sodium antiporter n=1 Tax=Neoroseomonas soli TaxID=1081025 RepID=A0A9X9WTE2_9PROT|nr:calcium/sodium antiporter [Neoroseomonas soli]MBR0670421.1 calcium/sodium antiporter [Neoroseomonas soli]